MATGTFTSSSPCGGQRQGEGPMVPGDGPQGLRGIGGAHNDADDNTVTQVHVF